MSKKHQNRLRELQRIKGMHSSTAPAKPSDSHINVITTSGDAHATQLHSTGAHALIRKDLATLSIVIAAILVVLFVINWALHNTGLEATLISLIQRIGS